VKGTTAVPGLYEFQFKGKGALGASHALQLELFTSTPRRAALEPKNLCVQPRHVEERDARGIQQRQEVTVEVAVRLLGRLVRDSVLLEPLGRPFAAVPIAVR